MVGRPFRTLVLASLVATHLAAGASADEPVGSVGSAVVYGTDDRLERYEITNPDHADLAHDAIVALVPANELDLSAPGTRFPPYADSVLSLAEFISASDPPLCVGERFADQPTAANCSGTLIAPDLVVTAGHCMATLAECRSYQYVFDYAYDAQDQLASLGADAVYTCKSLVVQRNTASPNIDYAVIQLDRAVVGRTPASLTQGAGARTTGESVVVLGFGSGLPMKYDAGGRVTNPRANALDAFLASTDTFGGNSGSGVFDAAGTMIGVLVAGEQDYESTTGCTRVNELSDAAGAEQVVYLHHVLDGLCDGGYPSVACPGNPAPTCGDRYCSDGESAANCAADCAGTYCADRVCQVDEDASSCPYDCRGVVTPRGAEEGCSCAVVGSRARRGMAGPLGALALGLWVAGTRRSRRRG